MELKLVGHDHMSRFWHFVPGRGMGRRIGGVDELVFFNYLRRWLYLSEEVTSS